MQKTLAWKAQAQQGSRAQCSCRMTKKWVVEITWKPLQAIFTGLGDWNNNRKVDWDLSCMPSLEKGGKQECGNIGSCSLRTVKCNWLAVAIPEGLSVSALIQLSSSLDLGWTDTGTHKVGTLFLTAEAMLLIYLLVSVSGQPVSFFYVSQHLSLSFKHYPCTKPHYPEQLNFWAASPLWSICLLHLNDSLYGKEKLKPITALTQVLNQHLWNYCIWFVL